jgi:hypothetical protein
MAARAGDDKVTVALKGAVNAVLKGLDSPTALKNFADGKPQP